VAAAAVGSLGPVWASKVRRRERDGGLAGELPFSGDKIGRETEIPETERRENRQVLDGTEWLKQNAESWKPFYRKGDSACRASTSLCFSFYAAKIVFLPSSIYFFNIFNKFIRTTISSFFFFFTKVYKIIHLYDIRQIVLNYIKRSIQLKDKKNGRFNRNQNGCIYVGFHIYPPNRDEKHFPILPIYIYIYI